MKFKPAVVVLFVLLGVIRLTAQVDSPAAPQLNNHHVILVPTSAPGTEEPMWIAVAPNGNLNVFPVSQLKEKLGEGYRPFTFGELKDAIASLMSTNAALNTEVKRLQALQSSQANQPIPAQSQIVDVGEIRRAQEQQRKEEQRQALLMFMLTQKRPSFTPIQVYQPPQSQQVDCDSQPSLGGVHTTCRSNSSGYQQLPVTPYNPR